MGLDWVAATCLCVRRRRPLGERLVAPSRSSPSASPSPLPTPSLSEVPSVVYADLDFARAPVEGDGLRLKVGKWRGDGQVVPKDGAFTESCAEHASRARLSCDGDDLDSPKCDPSYPDFCIKPFGPDLDCADIPYRNFRVVGNDYYQFDGNHDGVGCET